MAATTPLSDREKELLDRIRALEAQKGPEISFKVAPKRGLSVYFLGKTFPTTLDAAEWEKVLNASNDLRAFIKANRAALR